MNTVKKLMLMLVAVLLLASCATEVAIPYLRPSDINMGPYRNLALASTVPYRGYVGSGISGSLWIPVSGPGGLGVRISPTWQSNTAANVAAYATNALASTLSSSGYYNILSPSETDAILRAPINASREFQRRGYDAVMIPRIDAMNVNENIYTISQSRVVWDPYLERDMVEYYYDYYLKRIMTITYTITVVDTATDSIVAVKTFSDSRTYTDYFDPDWPSYSNSEYYFRRMIDSFQTGIRQLFIPSASSYHAVVMDNKPELAEANAGYDAIKNSDYSTALSVFTSCWNAYKHAPSGYNAALLIAAQGRYDDAIALLGEVKAVSPLPQIDSMISDIRRMEQYTREAESQLAPAEKYTIPDEYKDDSVYEYLMR